MRYISILIMLAYAVNCFAQPPLNKRDQKRKAEFEALIEAEESYEALIDKADRAFRMNDYVEARMAYNEAIPFNPAKEQWLVSKVNDLDILLAENAARTVDSVATKLPRKTAEQLKIDARPYIPTPRTTITQASHQQQEIEISKDIERVGEVKNSPEIERNVQLQPKKDENKPADEFLQMDDGMHEQTFEMHNHVVLRIVVKEGVDVKVFKRVKHNWGGEFYFLDDVSVTSRYWNEQVNLYRQKFATSGH